MYAELLHTPVSASTVTDLIVFNDFLSFSPVLFLDSYPTNYSAKIKRLMKELSRITVFLVHYAVSACDHRVWHLTAVGSRSSVCRSGLTSNWVLCILAHDG